MKQNTKYKHLTLYDLAEFARNFDLEIKRNNISYERLVYESVDHGKAKASNALYRKLTEKVKGLGYGILFCTSKDTN